MAEFRAICHTTCYKFLTIWHPGDVYEGERDPGKHFSADGKLGKPVPPAEPGFDPRSNKELIAECKKHPHNFTVPRSWPRKKIWAKLQDLEIFASKDALTNPEKKPNLMAAMAKKKK